MTIKKKFFSSGLVWLWVALVIIILDRFTKFWVVQNLVPYEPVVVLPIFNLTLAYNTGAAFSFLDSMSGWQNWFLGGLAVVISVGVIYWLSHISSRARWLSISLCLILSGALSNAWDRVQYGYVIDFLSFHLETWYFAIFNVADSAISIGAVMLILSWIKEAKDANK